MAEFVSTPAAEDRLETYRGKRDAAKTPEPLPPGHTPTSDGQSFVIQEHHASRLHWDFRLEHDGVLVSWALPKGVPTDYRHNHLAVQTEDHPRSRATYRRANTVVATSKSGMRERTSWRNGVTERR
jgi:bifunctional non-homologous end joining protein LigD